MITLNIHFINNHNKQYIKIILLDPSIITATTSNAYKMIRIQVVHIK